MQAQAHGPNATACMMRPGKSVKAPAITRAPRNIEIIALRCAGTRCLWAASTASGKVTRVKIDSKWIGLQGPQALIWLIRNEAMATASMSNTHIHPTKRWGIVPFGAASCTTPSVKAPSAAKAWTWMTGAASRSGASVIACLRDEAAPKRAIRAWPPPA